ncbi:hypothetical protein V6U81_21440 [Micromonospora sp. CPCC 205711]|uniref:hypothetical protein n=1 Tax=Micromonospora sp. CPCC 205547 TaxID=3122400 RepID=UPI002FF11084
MTDQNTPTPQDQAAHPTTNLSAVPVDEQTVQSGPQELNAEGSESGRRRLPLIGAAGAVALLLGGLGVFAATRGDEPSPASAEAKQPFVMAKEKCGTAASGGAELGDEGKTLTLRGDGKEAFGLSYSTLECYWSELDMPDSVKAEVGATRALDGRQAGAWGDIHASWSYHPDSGLQMILTLSD